LATGQVRCGLIGFGAWGQHHARAIAACADARLVAVAANSGRTAEAAREACPSARVYFDHRQMLAEERLDLCDVVVPSDLHFRIACDVLESGRHLLLEKPMALTCEDCRRLVDLAGRHERILAVGHELRMSSLWGKVKELVDTGAVGEPLYALIELWRRPYRPGSGGWRYDLNRVGDWILEEPIHFFDLARWYFSPAGEPTTVYAAANGKRPQEPWLHDNFSAVVHFPGGKHAVISQTLAAWEHHQAVKLTGTNGALWASWSGATDRTFEPTAWLRLQRGGGAPEEIPLATPSGEVYELVGEVAAVVRAVRDGTPVPCTGLDGWWSVAMCLKAAESVRTGRPVALQPPL
jgi:myo-inositol 2-dehydrogenase/D-chiro-inositol 1-dehydrogenase